MHGGRLKIAKVGLDKNPKTALAHGVRSAPTIRDAIAGNFQLDAVSYHARTPP
jgi:hypothetical protein